MNAQGNVALSADGVPIHYDVQGNGTTALVFVHGWCCDRHYWDRQVGHFVPQYTVVTLDLAGHGASGQARAQWTMAAFGQDIIAVVEQLGLEQVVLIGHAMSGAVIVEAARHLPTAVIGLVGVDTWRRVEQPLTPAEVAGLLAPLRANFAEAARTFVRSMFVPTSEPALAEQVVAAMSRTSPHIGISAAEEYWSHDHKLQAGLQAVKVAKIVINSDTWRATNIEEARRYGIEVVLMSGVGHFVMMEAPQTFNRLLGEAVKKFLHMRTPQ